MDKTIETLLEQLKQNYDNDEMRASIVDKLYELGYYKSQEEMVQDFFKKGEI